MSFVTNLTSAFQAVASTFKYLLYLPVKPADGDYKLRLVAGVASWLNQRRNLFSAGGPVTNAAVTVTTLVSGSAGTVEAGTYKVHANFTYANNTTTSRQQFSLTANAAAIANTIENVFTVNQVRRLDMTGFVTLGAAGALAVALTTNRVSGTGTATVTNMSLTIERWS